MVSIWRLCESRSVVEFIFSTICRLLSWHNYPPAIPGSIYRYHPAWCEVYTMNNRILIDFLQSLCFCVFFVSQDQREMKICRHCVSKMFGKSRNYCYFPSNPMCELNPSIHPSIDPPIDPSIHTYIHTCLLLSILMLWHRQAIFESKGDKFSSPAECKIRNWEV